MLRLVRSSGVVTVWLSICFHLGNVAKRLGVQCVGTSAVVVNLGNCGGWIIEDCLWGCELGLWGTGTTVERLPEADPP